MGSDWLGSKQNPPYCEILLCEDLLGKDVPVGRFGPQLFEHFEEFFLNTWINIYQYNNVFKTDSEYTAYYISFYH